jgi:outer membrane protein OmpA-like peptidoglycan-associated protein
VLKTYRASIIALFLGIGLVGSSLTGCEDAAAVAQSKATALESVSASSAKLVAAKATLDGLMKKVALLPAETVGLGALKEKLMSQKASLDKLETTISGISSKVEDIAKAGKKEDLDSFAKTIGTDLAGLDSIGTALGELSKSVVDMQTKAAAAAPTLASFARKLPNGYDLKASTDGIEHSLVDFVEDAKKAVDKSKVQLENVAEILKSFPKTKIKIGGYTDNTGVAEANKKISKSRADAVKKAIVDMGVDVKRLEAEGYGPEHPVCAANDTDECKAKNRRIAIRIAEK